MKAREKRRKRAARKANRPKRLQRAADILRRLYTPDEDTMKLLAQPSPFFAMAKRPTRQVIIDDSVAFRHGWGE